MKHWWEDPVLYPEYREKHEELLKEYRDKFARACTTPAENRNINDENGRARVRVVDGDPDDMKCEDEQ